jgi:ribonuclease G
MTEEILINFTPQETRVAVMQQGVVQELHIERTTPAAVWSATSTSGVSAASCPACSRLSSMSASNAPPSCMSPISGKPRKRHRAADRKDAGRRAEHRRPGVKDPIGTKGARLSTQISIAGRMLVYLPQEKHIGISQRIEAETEREALRERITRLVPEDEPGGFIVRTMAENASDGEFATDIAYLRKTWADIRDKARVSPPPTVLYQELSLGQRVLRDFVNPETGRIVIDSRENFQKLTAFAEEYTPAVLPLLDHYTGQRPLFDLHGVEEEIQKALARRVDLKSGGYLIIDQTEAMTTIDVNTGGFVGVRNFDDTIFKTNLEAAVTIARQLRLRNLGGIIIVDFIDMENEEHKKAVLEEFNKALASDHTRLTVNGFTALGLVEMTRKRTRESLAHVLCQPARPAAGAAKSRRRAPSPTKFSANCCAKRASSTPANTGCWPARRWSTFSRRRIAGAGHALRLHRKNRFPCNPNPAIRPSSTTSYFRRFMFTITPRTLSMPTIAQATARKRLRMAGNACWPGLNLDYSVDRLSHSGKPCEH